MFLVQSEQLSKGRVMNSYSLRLNSYIVEVKAGKGSDAGWGRLKSGAGFTALDFAKRV